MFGGSTVEFLLGLILLFSAGTRDSEGFFIHLTDVLKEGLGQYFSGRPDLKIIAEPGAVRGEGGNGEGGREGTAREGVS